MGNILTTEILATALGLATDQLLDLAARAPRMYRHKRKPKKSGRGMRTIDAPLPDLKKVQRKLLDNVLAMFHTHPSLFGSKGHAIKSAVRCHTKKAVVITMDISDFFPSIKDFMVRRALLSRGVPADAAKVMTRLMTCNNHLPQGAPTSTRMAMLVLEPAAAEIERLIASIPKTDLSVWVDDATLSGPIGMTRLIPTIVRIFNRYKFTVHPDKLKVMFQSQEQVSLGIKLNNGIEISTSFMEKYKKEGLPLPENNPRRKGMESHIRHINGQSRQQPVRQEKAGDTENACE